MTENGPLDLEEYRKLPQILPRPLRPAPRLAADDATVEISRYVTPTGLKLDDDVGFREWYSIGQTLLFLHQWTPWAVGDWINFGEDRWPDRYTQAMKITGRAIKTLYNCSYIARNVPPELRREELDFGHHDVVAPLEPDKQKKYLDMAVKEDKESGGHLTVPAFREMVKEERAKKELQEGSARVEKAPGPIRCPQCHGTGEVWPPTGWRRQIDE